ncbi:dof zinc finger protein 5 [Brachypodium distachyon]|uniref:Dof-type domain-containing protein n=1 Tax=Brachypodium distachyon TaxID=15368 RepID=I1HRS0_BRADI|nr:dof zinc finger protein 5 [Brachypodium distachyon]KQK09823.1 hypothetical protein BRADI_2g50370v3 [Brachypodium distachyon]|eukprot:XP_003567133.1 dof zinc finger protein 5 [Brachypodium distachyon]
MAPLVGAFKLFGKVITPPVPAVAGEEEPQRLPGDGERDRTAAIKREAPAGDLEGEETKQQGQGGGAARRTQLQESAEARAAAAPLPCPRCRSRDTKFCYFNNYNVNQPRHFCKACHRYWTAGGALRNVPVGAGRRKNRPLGPNVGANHHHHHRAPPAAGFNLAFPNAAASSPNSPSPVYTDGHWQAGPDRRF